MRVCPDALTWVLVIVAAAGGCTRWSVSGDAGNDQASQSDVPSDLWVPDADSSGHDLLETLEEPGSIDPGLDSPGDVGDPGGVDHGVDVPVLDVPLKDLPGDPGAETSGVCKLEPFTLEFGYVFAGGSSRRAISVSNIGQGNLSIDRFKITGSQDFAPEIDVEPTAVSGGREWVLAPPRVLAKNGTMQQFMVFSPTTDGKAEAIFEVFSSDTSAPDAPPKVFLRGNLQTACAVFVPNEVAFGPVMVGETATVSVRIESCGGKALIISSLVVDGPGAAAGVSLDYSTLPGGMAPTAAVPLTLAPGASVDINVVWAPTSAGPGGFFSPLSGLVTLVGNQFMVSTSLPLNGTAYAVKCAQPGIRPFEPVAVPAGTLLFASSFPSRSDFGVVNGYKWTVEQPVGNLGTLVPDDTRSDVSLFAAVPGDYIFHLEVSDDNGNLTCGDAVQKVTVERGLVAAMVLTWTNQDGSKVNPGAGPDLDLHVLHRFAPARPDGFDNIPYDCFWENRNPSGSDWECSGSGIDCVSMPSYSLDGMVPEVVVIQLSGCTVGQVFRFGADYPLAGAWGPVQATIAVVDNTGQIDVSSVPLAPGGLWEAGTFTCGSHAVNWNVGARQ